MRTLRKFISINALFFLLSTSSAIHTAELKSLTFAEKNLRHNLIASNRKVKTVITKGYGGTVDEASQNALKNALKQVVGSFIDSETPTKEREISDGIVKLSKTLKKIPRLFSGVYQIL